MAQYGKSRHGKNKRGKDGRGKSGRGNSRRGVAGIEFAMLAPLLLALLAGTVDLCNALLTFERLGSAAGSVANIASTGSAQFQALNKLTDVQAWAATTAPFAQFPGWTDPLARGTFAITLSAVSFTRPASNCGQGCGYVAAVQWSVANNLGQPRLRSCGTLASAADDAALSYGALPAGNFGPTGLLVADISYTFRPMFLNFLIGDIPMMRSAYAAPRINASTTLVAAGGAGASTVCTPLS